MDAQGVVPECSPGTPAPPVQNLPLPLTTCSRVHLPDDTLCGQSNGSPKMSTSLTSELGVCDLHGQRGFAAVMNGFEMGRLFWMIEVAPNIITRTPIKWKGVRRVRGSWKCYTAAGLKMEGPHAKECHGLWKLEKARKRIFLSPQRNAAPAGRTLGQSKPFCTSDCQTLIKCVVLSYRVCSHLLSTKRKLTPPPSERLAPDEWYHQVLSATMSLSYQHLSVLYFTLIL